MNIQCPGCASTYDVSGRPAGTLMTCHCGETFGFSHKLSAPVAFQCPGCGAHADPGAGRCTYCDRVLKSVCCPQCFTLLAEGEKYCVQCGTGVSAPALVVHRNGETALPCPRCSVALTASLAGDHLFDRCDRCGGIWAHHLAIAAVFAERGQRYSVADWLQRVSLPDSVNTNQAAPARCPDCEQTLHRQAVKGRTGVVIDACNDHGIWFDYRELRGIVGLPRRPRQRRKYKKLRRHGEIAGFLKDKDDWWPFEAIEDLLDFLEDLFD